MQTLYPDYCLEVLALIDNCHRKHKPVSLFALGDTLDTLTSLKYIAVDHYAGTPDEGFEYLELTVTGYKIFSELMSRLRWSVFFGLLASWGSVVLILSLFKWALALTGISVPAIVASIVSYVGLIVCARAFELSEFYHQVTTASLNHLLPKWKIACLIVLYFAIPIAISIFLA